MNKQQEIEKLLAKPIEVGDNVNCEITYNTIENKKVGRKFIDTIVENNKKYSGKVKSIINHPEYGLVYNIDTEQSIPYQVELKGLGNGNFFKSEWVKPSIFDCGAYPFKTKLDIRFLNIDIESLLLKCSYTDDNNYSESVYRSSLKLNGTYGGVNFNPKVIDLDGVGVVYQRPYVWSLKEKQLLISSIYNGIQIGTIIFKYVSWEDLETQINENGHGYSFDCVDGKQRVNTIIEFMSNSFVDEYGNLFSDLSNRAQMHFKRYSSFSYGELDDKTPDKDIMKTFLTLNFAGVQMSQEHVDYVKNINLK